jgi:hypothetical protein
MRELTGDARKRALAGTAQSFGMGMGVGLGSLEPILEDDVDTDTLLEASVEQRMGERIPVPTIGDRVSPLAPRRRPSIVGRDVESLEGPEATGLGGQIRRDAPSDDEDAENPIMTSEPVEIPEDEEMPEPMRTQQGRQQVAEEAISSLDKSYEEKLELMQKVFGNGEENKAEDRRMTLATIGLAIAAGQSPDALTNIAQGALAGLGAVGKRREARKAKGEKIKTLALDAALREQEEQQKFARELGLKTLELGNKAQYRDTPTVRQEGAFGDVEVYLPTPEASQQGVPPVLADPSSIDKKYKQSLEGRQKVFDMVNKAENLIQQYDIAGFDGAMSRLKQDLGASVPNFLKNATGFGKGSGQPTPQQEYDTLMRAMAAKFTPIILGESGRTISNGDRQRVAEILGFAVDRTKGKIGQYTGTSLTSEAELKSALNKVESILVGSYSNMDRVYSRYRPEQYQSLQENNQSQSTGDRIRFDMEGNPLK